MMFFLLLIPARLYSVCNDSQTKATLHARKQKHVLLQSVEGC